jgi:putative transcriptional regulator
MRDKAMDEVDFQNLLAGMGDVAAYRRGGQEGFVVHVPSRVDVKAIRTARRLSQEGFARTYGFSVAAVRDWEQGRRQPERAARLLLAMIDRAPDTVEKVMRGI